MASKEFIKGFLALYESFTCLWKIGSPEYGNKFLKDESYDELIKFCKRYYSEADKTFVQNKIQNLRTAFRKELKKINNAKRNNTTYIPRLWYFDMLLFTSNYATIEDSQEDLESIGAKHKNSTLSETEAKKRKIITSTQEIQQRPIQQPVPQLQIQQPVPQLPIPPRPIQQSSVHNNSISENRTKSIDEYEAMAITWAAKIRRLDEDQKILAEDLINQILRKAYFRELTRGTEILDHTPEISYSPPEPTFEQVIVPKEEREDESYYLS